MRCRDVLPAFSFASNAQTRPESVQTALTQGMTTLTQIEARIKADSGNVNHMGIDISASHDAYMDFASGKASMEAAAAIAMVGDIRAAFLAGNLTPVEAGQLQGVMAEVVGDAELAAEYISINLHDDGAMGTEIGATAQTYVDGGNGVGDNGCKRVGLVIHNNGYFQITDWNGYPEGKRPVGPFIVLEGEDYSVARDKANSTNSQLHRQNHSYQGLQIHEVHPVKFGGSPTELSNKVYLTPKEHAKFTVWWNRLLRQMNE